MHFLVTSFFIFIPVCMIELVKACGMECCAAPQRDCQELYDLGYSQSGVYHVTPTGMHDGIEVYCDMDTEGGGWLVIQRRVNGTVDFAREWNDYEIGFGNLTGEHWLGNLFLHLIISQFDDRPVYQLRVDLEDWEGNTAYANYKRFKIGDASSHYKLYIGGYSGTAGDSLKYHNEMEFRTTDYDVNGCASAYKNGWWFRKCHAANLNGAYRHDGGQLVVMDKNKNIGIQWQDWKGRYYSLKTVEMKIKRL